MKIFSIRNSVDLAQKVANLVGVPLSSSTRIDFKDGEFTVGFNESVRGQVVYIIGSTNILRGDNNLMELCMMVRSALLAKALEIIVIIPYFAWGRSDRKDIDRSSVNSKLVTEFIEVSGANHVILFDLHAIQTQSYYDIPSDHFTLDKLYVEHIKNTYDPENLIIASPDLGAAKRSGKIAHGLNADIVFTYKQRDKNNNIEVMKLVGDVTDKNVIFIDDIVDSANTLCKAADLAKANGAAKIVAYCTHAVLSDKAIETIENSSIETFYITDTISYTSTNKNSKIKVLTISNLISNIILRNNSNLSLANV